MVQQYILDPVVYQLFGIGFQAFSSIFKHFQAFSSQTTPLTL